MRFSAKGSGSSPCKSVFHRRHLRLLVVSSLPGLNCGRTTNYTISFLCELNGSVGAPRLTALCSQPPTSPVRVFVFVVYNSHNNSHSKFTILMGLTRAALQVILYISIFSYALLLVYHASIGVLLHQRSFAPLQRCIMIQRTNSCTLIRSEELFRLTDRFLNDSKQKKKFCSLKFVATSGEYGTIT